MRQVKNKVHIEGILIENNLEIGSYVKNGKTFESIHGNIKVLVRQTINGKPQDNEIPVYVFSNKYKDNGEPSSVFESLKRVKDEYVSAATAGSIEGADCVRITNGNIRMNEYFDQTGRFVSYPRINAAFINRVKKDDCNPRATFEVEFVVADQGYETNAEGENIKDQNGNDKYYVKGILVGYEDRIDVCKFYCANANVVNVVSGCWKEYDTVSATGRLNFTSTTTSETVKQGFGEPIVNTRTITLSDLVITGGSDVPLDEPLAFEEAEIQKGLAARRARLEMDKEKTMSKTRTAPAPTPANTNSSPAAARRQMDLGF